MSAKGGLVVVRRRGLMGRPGTRRKDPAKGLVEVVEGLGSRWGVRGRE